MNYFFVYKLVLLLTLVLLIEGCWADDSPGVLAYLQGGNSILEKGVGETPNETYTLTIDDLVSSYHLSTGERSFLMPVKGLLEYPLPLNAAISFSNESNESVSIVQVTNISLSDQNKVLVLTLQPLEFYDGNELQSFVDQKQELITGDPEKYLTTGLYFELPGGVPENKPCTNTCQNILKGFLECENEGRFTKEECCNRWRGYSLRAGCAPDPLKLTCPI